MNWETHTRNVLLLSMLSLLASCGGSSKSTSPTPPPVQLPPPASQVDQAVKVQWSGVTSALLAGDKQTAMTYLTDDAQLKYGPVFDVLMPEFKQILLTWSPLLNSSISSSTAEYAIVTDNGTKRQLFYVHFRLDDDGAWRLESM